MPHKNLNFGYLLKDAVTRVALSLRVSHREVDNLLADEVSYAVASVRRWKQGFVPKHPDSSLEIADFCIKNRGGDAAWARSFLHAASFTSNEIESFLDKYTWEPKSQSLTVFILHASKQVELVRAITLAQSFPHIRCLMDQHTESTDDLGTLMEQIEYADAFIYLLSKDGVHSESVASQLEYLTRPHALNQGHKPLLTVRLGYYQEVKDWHASLLARSAWTYWETEEDTTRVIGEIKDWLSSGRLPEAEMPTVEQGETDSLLPQPTPRAIKGTIQLDSPFRIKRQIETELLKYMDGDLPELLANPFTLSIQGNRQCGKTSLLHHLITHAEHSGYKVAWVDLQLYETCWNDPDQFYYQFCLDICHSVDSTLDPLDLWNERIPVETRVTYFLVQHVLEKLETPLLLIIDEVEKTLKSNHGHAFMSLLRSWVNSRTRHPAWKKLNFLFATSTEPKALLDDPFKSPFNVAQKEHLSDFSITQTHYLHDKYGEPLTQAQFKDLYHLLNGHPFLTQHAFYLLAKSQFTFKRMIAESLREDGPFGDHLRDLRLQFLEHPKLKQGIYDFFMTKDFANHSEETGYRLDSAGLIRKRGSHYEPRCQLYVHYIRGYFSHYDSI